MTPTDTTPTPDLLPCPFCGGEAHHVTQRLSLDDVDWVQCRKCSAATNVNDWNTRPTPQPDAVEKIREALATAFYNVHVPCSHTDSHGWHTYCHTLADVALNYFPTPALAGIERRKGE